MLITVNELRSYSIETINAIPDKELKKLIELYSLKIEEYCKTKFKPTKCISKNDTASKIYLNNKPVLCINHITCEDELLVENVDYFLYQELAYVEIEKYLPFIRKGLEISYMYGYNKVPASVKSALMELIKLHIDFKSANSTLTSENFANEYSYTKDNNLNDYQLSIFESLKNLIQDDYTPEISVTNQIRARFL